MTEGGIGRFVHQPIQGQSGVYPAGSEQGW